MLGLVLALALAQQPQILTFEARPDSIKPGESVFLVWNTEGLSGMTIEPEVGAVSPRGILQLTPMETTTYTLKARGGPSRSIKVTVEGAESGGTDAAPKPDFSGVYNTAALPSDAPQPALKPGAEKYRVTKTGAPECKPSGIPQAYAEPHPFQIIQTPKFIAQIFGYPNPVRIIPLDGRAHPADPGATWMGNAVGHWEGTTLVVDTIGFNDKTEVNGFTHTTALHVVERFTRQENGDLQYEVTVDDANVFAKPWLLPARTFTIRPDADWVDESIC
jgi:hypothetical protein